jgi:molecular chaperone GrpE
MHQAMFEAENKDVAEGTIVEVVQAGYVIAGRVLRPALVGVARGGEKPARAEPAPAPAEALKATVDASAKPEAGAKPAAEGAAKKDKSKGKKKLGGKLDKRA